MGTLMKKKKGKNSDYKRVILVSTMFICIIISMCTYWVFAYKNKYGYLHINKKIVSYKLSDYTYTSGDILYLKGIDSEINDDFLKRQRDITSNNRVIDTRIMSGIYSNILSIKISYVLYGDLANYEEVITVNIDLVNDTVISNDDLIDRVGSSYSDIANDIFDSYIILSDDYDKMVVDAIDNSEISASEFNRNKYKYVVRIREMLPSNISLYIDDGRLYYMVRMNDVNKLCYYTNMDSNMSYINKEIGKL